ncbi:unnamed protein product [Caenorhabditis auriculariae]|uniref:Aminopeptidase N-like N-terminal domain-containing protein n=1 Tax=Caenorhabditis auriculariae TaxID=2777116 RepID=A0A8S1HSG6_9PELO|nr:unnamed protein product [Caenorhabditis auriculariae]
MRPYSVARDTSRTAATPLFLAVGLFSMILLLIYLLVYFPVATPRLATSPTPPTPKRQADEATQVDVAPATTDLYAFIDRVEHRRQIPMLHQPFLYAVRLKLYLPWKPNVTFGENDFALEGHLRMHFVSGGGSRILLHSVDQHIGDCSLLDEFGRSIGVKQVRREHSQLLDFELMHDMISGMNYTLDIPFRGHISQDKQDGIFASPYKHGEETRFLTATHLQTTEARSVFPCIDIPEVKAQYDVVVEHPTGTSAVSNMMENETSVDGNWTVTKFHRTPPMSTYLFALAVSDFPFLESHSSQGIRIRVYCDPLKIADSVLMLDSTGPLLDFFTDYFGIPYPLDKLGPFIFKIFDSDSKSCHLHITRRIP